MLLCMHVQEEESKKERKKESVTIPTGDSHWINIIPPCTKGNTGMIEIYIIDLYML